MITTRKRLTAGAFVLVTGALVAATACTTHTTTIKPSAATPPPAPTVTQTQTQTVAPPPPPANTQIAQFAGSGNENTKSFTVPASGDYTVTWSYSGNSSLGSGDNFIIQTTGSNGDSFGLPNDIAASGHGSTEVTGDSGTQSFNVQSDSTCSWTITVVSAP